MKKQAGFSLVELVIVIVVVGLLAVAALPKFLDVTDEAKKASIEGVAGGFATAVLSARAQWEAESRPEQSSVNVVDYDGVNFILTDSDTNGFRDGYPIAVAGNTISAVTSVTNAICVDLMENLLQNPPIVAENNTSDSDARYSAASGTGNTSCVYTQLEGTTNHSFEYDITTGRVVVNLTN
jgi:MSHA pilin protein MshB